jgi:hypothetical protein
MRTVTVRLLVWVNVWDSRRRPDSRYARRAAHGCFRLRIQPVNATIWLYISAGVWKSSVFLGRSLSFLATAFNCACE